MRFSPGRLAAVFLALVAACTPALDWRQAHLEGSGVAMLFPCRPDRHERPVRLAGVDLPMQMHSCRASNASFSLTYVDAVQPAQVGALLDELRARAVANVAGTGAFRPFAVPGATPNEHGAQLRIEGRLPDGRAVTEHAVFFVRGLRVFQATVLGEAVPAETLETFFGAIKVTP